MLAKNSYVPIIISTCMRLLLNCHTLIACQFPVDAGFLVEVIRLWLQGVYSSRYLLLTVFTPHGVYSSRCLLLTVFTPHGFCCRLRCVWIAATRCYVARFIQLRTNCTVISPILSYCRLSVLVYFCFLYAEPFTDVRISRRVPGCVKLCVVAVAGFPSVPFIPVYVITALLVELSHE